MQRKLPCGVVSLFDLLKFNAHLFVDMARKISLAETLIGHFKSLKSGDALAVLQTPLPEEVRQFGISAMPELMESCRDLFLDSAEDQAKRMAIILSSNPTIEQLASAFTELQNRIEDQLARRYFYQLKPNAAPFFEVVNPFGELVATSFPSATHDISEGCKCYACDRFDATVYHLMRAMEVALRCLAKRVNVKYAPNWMVYLDRIDNTLKSKAKKSRLRKSRLLFLGNTSALLRAVKEAWRDDTMHVAGKYGPDQTRDILMSVRAFMIHLSAELSEK